MSIMTAISTTSQTTSFFEWLKTTEQIIVEPLAYMRGTTYDRSIMLLDEAQNCSVKQMLMTLTRIGDGSKMIITGDPSQHDRGFEKSGLTDLIERLYRKNNNEIKGIAHIQFTAEHVERHPIIKQVLDLYD